MGRTCHCEGICTLLDLVHSTPSPKDLWLVAGHLSTHREEPSNARILESVKLVEAIMTLSWFTHTTHIPQTEAAQPAQQPSTSQNRMGSGTDGYGHRSQARRLTDMEFGVLKRAGQGAWFSWLYGGMGHRISVPWPACLYEKGKEGTALYIVIRCK